MWHTSPTESMSELDGHVRMLKIRLREKLVWVALYLCILEKRQLQTF